jgi:hypothetical protein
MEVLKIIAQLGDIADSFIALVIFRHFQRHDENCEVKKKVGRGRSSGCGICNQKVYNIFNRKECGSDTSTVRQWISERKKRGKWLSLLHFEDKLSSMKLYFDGVASTFMDFLRDLPNIHNFDGPLEKKKLENLCNIYLK